VIADVALFVAFLTVMFWTFIRLDYRRTPQGEEEL